MEVKKHYIVRVKRPIDKAPDPPNPVDKPAKVKRDKLKKPRGQPIPPRTHKNKRDKLRDTGFDYYVFMQSIDLMARWFALLKALDCPRPNMVLTRLVEEDVKRMEVQLEDGEKRN